MGTTIGHRCSASDFKPASVRFTAAALSAAGEHHRGQTEEEEEQLQLGLRCSNSLHNVQHRQPSSDGEHMIIYLLQ